MRWWRVAEPARTQPLHVTRYATTDGEFDHAEPTRTEAGAVDAERLTAIRQSYADSNKIEPIPLGVSGVRLLLDALATRDAEIAKLQEQVRDWKRTARWEFGEAKAGRQLIAMGYEAIDKLKRNLPKVPFLAKYAVIGQVEGLGPVLVFSTDHEDIAREAVCWGDRELYVRVK